MSASIFKSSVLIHETMVMIDGLSSLIDETTLMICLWMQVFGSLRPNIWEFGSRRNVEGIMLSVHCYFIAFGRDVERSELQHDVHADAVRTPIIKVVLLCYSLFCFLLLKPVEFCTSSCEFKNFFLFS